jgi:hypothetical protein
LDGYALSFVQYDALNLLQPNTPTNRFRLMQRYVLATFNARLNKSDNRADECDWFFVTCAMIDLGPDIGVQNAVRKST